MSMSLVRKSYGVPAKRGGRVIYLGGERPEHGTICGARGVYLKIRMDGDTHSGPYHPTWMLEYVSSRDPSHGDQ